MTASRLVRLVPALALILLTAACGLRKGTPAASSNIEVTHAYQTVAARVTENWQVTPSPAADGITPTVKPPTSAAATARPAASSSPASLQTPTGVMSSSCNRAAPGIPAIDVTIDDYTEMLPGEEFTKIWRLANAGDCTWTREYSAVYFFGEKMGDTQSISLSSEVSTGGQVDIAVDMVAPLEPGDYRSSWMLSDDQGALFGIGPNGDLPFWVQIVVIPPDTPTPTDTPPPTQTGTPTIEPSQTPTPTSTPRVQASGPASLDPNSSIDLDSNTVNPTSGADLAYQQDGSSVYWLIPQEPAVLGFWGLAEPNLNDCLAAVKSISPISVGSLTPGTYLCYQTDSANPGWVRYDSFDGNNARLEMTILTWEAR